MPITSVTKDLSALTMTVVADFNVPLQRLWDAFADPRQLEKFWGPPTFPARFTRHDMVVGGRSEYTMTGPNGELSPGYWEFTAVDAPRGFEVRDGFANPDGTNNPDMPQMRMVYTFEETASGARVSTTTHFPSQAALKQLLEMGMEEGMTSAMGQMDAVVGDLASFAVGLATAADILSDTRVRVARVIRGTVAQVWLAHHDAALMQRWLLGPDGWTMPVCEIATAVGESYRYEWASDDGDQRFGFEGELLESVPPSRAVTTERMMGMDGPQTVNELTLTPVEGGTLLSIVITYPSVEVRDAILATGMTTGMETSYQRLEAELLGSS